LVHPKLLAPSAIKVEGSNATSAAAAPEQDPPVEALLGSADPKKGEADTQAACCVACHSFNEGGKSGVGPNLYGVLGAPHCHAAGFDYSAVLKGRPGPWTYDELCEWLKKPSAYAPGTKMTYAGLADPKKRAEIVAYLRSLSSDPEPLPAAPAKSATAPAPAPAAAASGGPPPGAAPAGNEKPFAGLLASADPKAGQALVTKLGCVACHTFNDGGKAGVGPNLYGVVGAPHGHMQGYAYSDALKAKSGPWTFDELNEWLAKPAAYAPGTKMTFVGIPNTQQRADMIDYLHTLSPNPEPLPGTSAPAAAPAPETAPATPAPVPSAPTDGNAKPQ
jgi:cytochrome c